MSEPAKDNAPPKKRLKIIPVLFVAAFFIIQILAYFLIFIRYFRIYRYNHLVMVDNIFDFCSPHRKHRGRLEYQNLLGIAGFGLSDLRNTLICILSSAARTENGLQADKKAKKNCQAL